MRTPTTLFFLCLLWCSCMRQASFTVLQPAQMTLPEHISKVAIVDRSKPSNGWLNVLEGLITGEAIGQDRQSRQEAVRGLEAALQRTPRFSVIRTGIEKSGSKAGVGMPPPLEWQEVEQICADYGANAVVTIESFDSDNHASTQRNENKRKDKNGKEYIEITYSARQRTGVTMGWRLYDPKSRIILDEYTTNDYLERNASGDTERNALGNLPAPVSVTRTVAYNGGSHYGMRIAPVYVRETRAYYPKAKGQKNQMKEAARLASAEKWESAAAIWKKIVDNPTNTPKTAGRAAYNMAVAAEVKGELDVALEWAEEAYTHFGNKKARGYIQTLKQRQNDERKVEGQMNKKKV
ncbi:MAG: hypothetical protein KGS48_04725 [Bacteroidetes bacterium]|nr:hypothetical protein [Bacteroidota bacterium]